MDADADYVMSFFRLCKGYAQDDEVEQTAMNSYLLRCINDELEEKFYNVITVLPKDNEEEG